MKDKLSSKKAMVVLTFVGLYLLSTGLSWAVFSFVRTDPGRSTASGRAGIDPSLPKTEECPINGMLYTEPEREVWEERRPIAAIVENHADSRPPSGLSKADVVYEAVAEGGITRFLTIYHCGAAAADVQIAPVRSARVYYIDWAAEYGENPIFMHVGGANDYAGFGDTVKAARALELLETMGWRVAGGNDFDTTFDSGFPVFWRNYERLGRTVATEHTMMASLDAAHEQAVERGFGAEDDSGDNWDETFVPWEFADDDPSGNPSATKISFEFWENSLDSDNYGVVWVYDSGSNSYLRENGGEEHIDLATETQLSSKNVVILFADERSSVDRNKHILYTTIDTGDAMIFQNGEVIIGTWEKDARKDRTKFFDESGAEVTFVRGPIWIEVLPTGNDVNY